MNFNTYQFITGKSYDPEQEGWELAVKGTVNLLHDASDFTKYLKNHLGHLSEPDINKVMPMLCDVLWDITQIATSLGVRLEDVAILNMVRAKDDSEALLQNKIQEVQAE